MAAGVRRTARLTDETAICEVIGHTLRVTREEHGYSQANVAEQLGIHQATVSSIELGQRCASLPELAVLEAWWRLPPGYLARRAGLVADPTSTRDAIAHDASLNPSAREMLLAAYDAMTNRGRRR